jgi:copper chaperone NosL
MDAKKAHFVYDSRRDGVMGVEPVAFSDKKAAERFIEQWGGRLLTYPDITLATLDSAH